MQVKLFGGISSYHAQSMHGGQLATARTKSLEGRMQQRNASTA
jgi:hypothetical protein